MGHLLYFDALLMSFKFSILFFFIMSFVLFSITPHKVEDKM